jgi:hypothetical protein
VLLLQISFCTSLGLQKPCGRFYSSLPVDSVTAPQRSCLRMIPARMRTLPPGHRLWEPLQLGLGALALHLGVRAMALLLSHPSISLTASTMLTGCHWWLLHRWCTIKPVPTHRNATKGVPSPSSMKVSLSLHHSHNFMCKNWVLVGTHCSIGDRLVAAA